MHHHAESGALSNSKSAHTQETLPQKQIALELLGTHKDGSFGVPKNNTATKKPYATIQMAFKFNVSKAAVSSWRKQAYENCICGNIEQSYQELMQLVRRKMPHHRDSFNQVHL